MYLVIGDTQTTRNYSMNEEKITILLEITRVPSNFLLPYPTLLGFEKPLLVIAWISGMSQPIPAHLGEP